MIKKAANDQWFYDLAVHSGMMSGIASVIEHVGGMLNRVRIANCTRG